MIGNPSAPASRPILDGRILIVDDLAADVRLLERILRGAGYTSVASTMDSGAVCELHRRNPYDLILLDLLMPGQDGFQVMEGLKRVETGGYLPVLAVTADAANKIRALQGGARDFISKPFEVREVLTRAHNLIEVRLLHEAARTHSQALESLSLRDPLTGLANRRLLAERMAMALVHARRNTSVMAVLYLDLDGFKPINDTLGHGVGDALLKLVAGRLQATVREEDTVARVGGDEFVVALWHVSGADQAAAVAAKVVDAVSQPCAIEGHTVRVTTSVGVAIYPDHGEDADTLLKSADVALYQAKGAGKNVFRISQPAGMSAVAHGPQAPPASGTPRPDAPARTGAA